MSQNIATQETIFIVDERLIIFASVTQPFLFKPGLTSQETEDMVQDNYNLIKMAAKGDKDAFEALIKKYDRKVITLALKYTRSEEDAKDIYQEVFIRVYKNISKFEFKSEFSTWLFRITTNVCLSYIENSKKRQTVDLLENNSQSDDEDAPAFEIAGSDLNPEMQMGNSELNEAIRHAVDNLSAKQKLVFTMKHYEGYKLKEIAELTGLVEGTVKRYLFDATLKLRESLKQFYN